MNRRPLPGYEGLSCFFGVKVHRSLQVISDRRAADIVAGHTDGGIYYGNLTAISIIALLLPDTNLILIW